jgi:hypothetical protein
MESIWTVPWIPYGIVHEFVIKFIGNSMDSIWNPHGPVHGFHMECTIPWTFHMESIWNP